MRRAAGCVLRVLAACGLAATAHAAGDRGLQAHGRELVTLQGAVPAVLVIEIREIVERAAGRGGASVGVPSLQRHIEAFEAALLAQARPFACAVPRRAPAAPGLLQAVRTVDAQQRLALGDDEVPALSARLQRLIESVPQPAWCRLRTLEPLR